MRKMIASALLLLTLSCAPTQEPTDQFHRALEASVKLEAVMGHGSGVVIRPDGLTVTAAHVCDILVRQLDKPFYLIRPTGEKVEGRVWWVGEEALDTCFVKPADPVRWAYASLARRDATLGEHVFLVGNPGELEWVLTYGRVAREVVHAGGKSVYAGPRVQLDLMAIGGTSGGGVFNMRGEISGILTQVYAPKHNGNYAFAVKVSAIRQQLEESGL